MACVRSVCKENIDALKMHLNTMDFGLFSHRELYYEVIGEDQDAFGEIAFDQIKLLFTEADDGNNSAIEDLDSLMYLIDLENFDKKYISDCKNILCSYMDSKKPEVRIAALDNFCDLVDSGQIKLDPDLIERLQRQIYDENLDVKLMAYFNLKDIDILPPGFKLSWMDKIRARFKRKGYLVE